MGKYEAVASCAKYINGIFDGRHKFLVRTEVDSFLEAPSELLKQAEQTADKELKGAYGPAAEHNGDIEIKPGTIRRIE